MQAIAQRLKKTKKQKGGLYRYRFCQRDAMSSVTVAVHGKVVHKRQYRYRASSAGGRALVHLGQLATGRKVKASNLVYYDMVRGVYSCFWQKKECVCRE